MLLVTSWDIAVLVIPEPMNNTKDKNCDITSNGAAGGGGECHMMIGWKPMAGAVQ